MYSSGLTPVTSMLAREQRQKREPCAESNRDWRCTDTPPIFFRQTAFIHVWTFLCLLQYLSLSLLNCFVAPSFLLIFLFSTVCFFSKIPFCIALSCMLTSSLFLSEMTFNPFLNSVISFINFSNSELACFSPPRCISFS